MKAAISVLSSALLHEPNGSAADELREAIALLELLSAALANVDINAMLQAVSVNAAEARGAKIYTARIEDGVRAGDYLG